MEQVYERRAIQNGIVPQTLNAARLSSGSVDMRKYKHAFFMLYIGAITGSVSAWLQESTDDSSWTTNDTAGAFSGSTGTPVSLTGMTTASAIICFEVRADQLTAGYRYVRLQIKEVNSSNALVCATAEGCDADFQPARLGNGTHSLTNGNKIIVI
jgi:hypothetical protein